MERAVDRLAPEGGASEVAWRITGTTDALGRPALEIRLDGSVPLECQRCLQPFAWPVAQCTMLLLARDERELARARRRGRRARGRCWQTRRRMR